MKTKEKGVVRLAAVSILMMAAVNASAQTMVYYSYDASGNRVSRSTTVSKTRSADSDSKDLSEEINQANKVHIIQNPTMDMVTVEIDGWSSDTHAALIVYALSGITVVQRPVKSQRTEIDMSTYEVGCYILQVTIGDKKYTWKIIKG